MFFIKYAGNYNEATVRSDHNDVVDAETTFKPVETTVVILLEASLNISGLLISLAEAFDGSDISDVSGWKGSLTGGRCDIKGLDVVDGTN